jgi:hypothetical protein
MDNANPTVLNVADLPTRRGKGGPGSKKTAGSEIQQLMQIQSHYMMQDLYLSDLESAPESDEDIAVEPIDEQEIYGKSMLQIFLAPTDKELPRPHLYHLRS